MRQVSRVAQACVIGSLAMASSVALGQGNSKEQAALAAALGPKHVALVAGIQAAASTGTPISAKYEYEDGKLQLSVYTEKGGQFSEVIVDQANGKVAKTEKMTDPEDLKAAKSQSAAAAAAKSSLTKAVEKALAANAGFSAVSATAAMKGGKPVAEITLIKGTEFKSVTQPLV
jgi:hypothetical protein